MSVWWRLLGYLRPYRGTMAIALVAMVLLALATGAYPAMLDLLTSMLFPDAASGPSNLERALEDLTRGLGFLGLSFDRPAVALWLKGAIIPLFVVVVLAKVVAQAVRFYAMGYLGTRVIHDLRGHLYQSLLAQDASYFDDQATGFLVSRVMNDVAQVERAATYALPILIGDALKVVTLSAVCLFQYPELSLVSLIVTPLAIFPIVRFGKFLKRYAKRAQEGLGLLTHRITETVGGIRVVHAYGREGYELERFLADSRAYMAVNMKSVLVRAVQTPAMELIGVLALLLTLGYAFDKVESGEIRAAEVVAFLLALVLLYEPLKAIGRLNGILMPGVASAERVFQVIDRPPLIIDGPGARPFSGVPEQVHFQGVCFRYREDRDPVLEGFELVLPRGQVVALVGPSGGGKSTVAAMLPRLYDPTHGRITVDGVDLKDLTLESWRAQIAMVAQETYLFDDTIMANIAYGRPGATQAEIEAAAQKAYAHDFIQKLPSGYATRVGERGVQLSGGQRQRLAIARAFLRDAPILILDEATSALDVESEREVQAALDALLQDRTALVIAHRLSTIRRATEIVVLERGKIVERGTHQSLLERNGLYARLIAMGEAR